VRAPRCRLLAAPPAPLQHHKRGLTDAHLLACTHTRVHAQDPKVTADRAYNQFGTNYDNSAEPIYGTQVRGVAAGRRHVGQGVCCRRVSEWGKRKEMRRG